MITKQIKPNPLRRKLTRYFIYLEVSVFLSSLGLYVACNRSQSTRKFFHDSKYFSAVLDSYYYIGENFGTQAVKDYDSQCWTKK